MSGFDRDVQAELVALRRKYESLEAAYERSVKDSGEYVRAVELDRRDALDERALLLRQRGELAGELATIRASLAEVAVFDADMIGSYLTTCVAELVRDHEELEARIDAAVMTGRAGTSPEMTEVLRLLAGGVRTPDGPGDL